LEPPREREMENPERPIDLREEIGGVGGRQVGGVLRALSLCALEANGEREREGGGDRGWEKWFLRERERLRFLIWGRIGLISIINFSEGLVQTVHKLYFQMVVPNRL
jgi:hypothetical protein